MSPMVIMWTFAVIGALILVLTHIRLGRPGLEAAGRFQVGRGVVWVHTIFGVIGLIAWGLFLYFPAESALGSNSMGLLGLGCWWVVAICGLLLLTRWSSPKGRHADKPTYDSWSDGPALSYIAHLSVVIGVIVDTWMYLTGLI